MKNLNKMRGSTVKSKWMRKQNNRSATEAKKKLKKSIVGKRGAKCWRVMDHLLMQIHIKEIGTAEVGLSKRPFIPRMSVAVKV